MGQSGLSLSSCVRTQPAHYLERLPALIDLLVSTVALRAAGKVPEESAATGARCLPKVAAHGLQSHALGVRVCRRVPAYGAQTTCDVGIGTSTGPGAMWWDGRVYAVRCGMPGSR